ncbi:tail protein [Streptococcus phage 115]|nr:tail protein [Streptococcus phage 115]
MAKVQATMSTEIALDTLQAANSIKRLTQLVNSSTSAWKAQESQMRSAGDYLGAAQAKYDGLGNSIQNQQQKIEKLKQEQSQLKGSTVEVAEQYLKYQQQIDQATTRLAALENQQRQAKSSLDYHKSGLADLQKAYHLSNNLSESYVKRLQAEGRESEALQAKLNASKNAVNNLNKQYEAQVKLLKEVAQSGDGDAYVKQKIRINETATALAHAKNEVSQLKNDISGLNDRIVVGSNFLGSFKDKLSFGAIAGLASNAVQNLTSQISGLWQEAMQASDSIEKFESTMKFAGFGKKEIKEASKEFKKYADETVYDLQDITSIGSQLASNNIKNYKELAKSAGNLNSVAGGNKETFQSLGLVMTQTAGAGKLTTDNWNQLANAIPGASGILQKEMKKNGAYTGNFRKAMEEGQISSEELFKAIEKLGSSKGAEKAAKSTKTFEGVFGQAKASVVSGMNDVIKTIGKEDLTNGIKGLSKFTKTAFGGLVNTLKYLKDHESTVKTIGSMMVTYFVASKIASGITAIKTATQGATLAQKALNLAMKANPYVLVATAVVGIGVALYELYKHNKKFKKFVDDLAKNAKKAFDNIVKWFKDIPKNLRKTWDNIKDGAKSGMKNLGSAITGKLSDIGKEWNKGWKKSKDYLSDRWDDMKGNTKESIKRLGSSIKDKHDEIHDRWSKTWNKSKDFLSARWDDMNADTKKKFGNDLKGLLFDNLDKIKNKFQDIWNGIRNGFSDMWNGLKDLAGNGINAVIKIPNDGIDGINGLIHDFGGPKNAIGKIPKVKFADGTGLFSSFRNPITRPTLATLNDGNDSPETNNQEMVILPNGKSFLPQGRNVDYLLPAGSEVINASELATLMGVERGAYAKGTGFWSKIWDTTTNVAGSVWDTMKNGVDKFMKMIEFIGSAIKDPVGSLAKKFNPNADKLAAMFNPLGNALYKKPVGEAKNWWKELWSMANASMDEGTVAIGAKGDDYRFKDKAKDAGADPWGYYYRECVSFIASRLANLGVNPSLFSHLGNGNQWVNARVPHLSRPKPGTVAVYTGGPVSSNHADFVTAVHGDTYDGEEYNYGGTGQYHQYTGRHIANAATFLDFGVRDFGSSGEDGKPLKDRNNPLQTLIKRQVGGMFDWIKKTLGPLLSPAGGGEDHPQGTGVARWRESVVKALQANDIEPTDFRVSKILATIQRESGGNPNAQNNWDINAILGHPSIGLMQTIGPTFNAYKHKGHDNIRNGYDNLLAAINYIKHRYGTSDAAFNRVAAYGYANGGLVHKNGVYELAEGDMPEYVIPTDIAKRGRAWQLLTEAVARFAGDAPQNNHDNSSSHQRVSILEDKLDVMIGLLSQLVTNGSKPIEIQNIIDGRSVSNGLAPFITKATNEYERRQALLGGQII